MQPQGPIANSFESSQAGDPTFRFLDWDSEFFGRRIGLVQGRRLSKSTLAEMDRWRQNLKIDCLYFLADFDDPETIQLAEDNLFRLVDIRVTLGSTLSPIPESEKFTGRIRPSEPRDLPVLRSIARSSHTGSRFYFDPNFPRDRCDALYETWIEKSLTGDADVVLVPEIEGEAVGYISCHIKPGQKGLIGLVGLALKARGKDLGPEMVRAAQRWFLNKQVQQVSVVTQGRNVAAQRVYQRCGFCTESLQLWFHRWFSPNHRTGQ